jgi:hypothetical protein
MARLISPNGVEVDANEGIVKALLDNGYRRAGKGQGKQKAKPKAKAKPKKSE